MKKILFFSLTTVATASIAQVKKPVSTAAKPKPVEKVTAAITAPIAFKTLKDSASYALGLNIAHNVKSQIGDINLALLHKGLDDVFSNKKAAITEEAANACIGEFQQKTQSAKADGNKAKGKAFLVANAQKKGVVTLPSGLEYEVIKAGTSTQKPTLTDTVKCHYHGTLLDGTVFDSSVDRGEPISFPLGGVIKGWQEALQLMTVGSKWRIFIPSDLAYGDNAAGPKIGPGSALIFEVELLGISK